MAAIGFGLAEISNHTHGVARKTDADIGVAQRHAVKGDIPRQRPCVGGVYSGGVAQGNAHIGIGQKRVAKVDLARGQPDGAGVYLEATHPARYLHIAHQVKGVQLCLVQLQTVHQHLLAKERQQPDAHGHPPDAGDGVGVLAVSKG